MVEVAAWLGRVQAAAGHATARAEGEQGGGVTTRGSTAFVRAAARRAGAGGGAAEASSGGQAEQGSGRTKLGRAI
ncbi:hypothetical protein E2562_020181 [Oryza meyeriana var. granulata]|uniref:DUF834 domain-containing protein n=1 Tax=Oryza meyeriana var. granulata TaxID=110450 RepID=A0A6G1BNK2_9ORYZ|nr:hypothetical protein E2562_020181 [Oryza meyeriana var. granulata]